MEAEHIGSVLFVMAYPGLPIVLILAPLVRKLWTTERGRARAVEELLLSLGVLLAPGLFLTGMQSAGLAPRRGVGWLLTGLFVAVPLWAVASLLLLLLPALITQARRLARSPESGEPPPTELSGFLLPLVTAVLGLMLTLVALEISLNP